MIELAGVQPRDDDRVAELLLAGVPEAHRLASSILRDPIGAEDAVQDGSPSHRLVEEAVNWDADLVVVGHHGQGGLERLLVGSVARSVLYHAPCSVLVVPRAATPAGANRE